MFSELKRSSANFTDVYPTLKIFDEMQEDKRLLEEFLKSFYLAMEVLRYLQGTFLMRSEEVFEKNSEKFSELQKNSTNFREAQQTSEKFAELH